MTDASMSMQKKTEYMCFIQNQRGDISTLKSGSWKLVDKFTYLGSRVSSKENDINIRQAIDRLSAVYIYIYTNAYMHVSMR